MTRDADGPFEGLEVVSRNVETGEVVIAIDRIFFENHRLEGMTLEHFRRVLDENEDLKSVVLQPR